MLVMASAADARRSPFSIDPHHQGMHKAIPILPSSSASSTLTPPRDPMDITPSTLPVMGPPILSSPVAERNSGIQNIHGDDSSGMNGGSAPAIGAAAAAQQPKVVQTAFIHKLYKWVSACAKELVTLANTIAACWRTKAYNILSLGRAQTRVLSCPLRASSPKSCRKYT
jgi:hypothetical protein